MPHSIAVRTRSNFGFVLATCVVRILSDVLVHVVFGYWCHRLGRLLRLDAIGVIIPHSSPDTSLSQSSHVLRVRLRKSGNAKDTRGIPYV